MGKSPAVTSARPCGSHDVWRRRPGCFLLGPWLLSRSHPNFLTRTVKVFEPRNSGTFGSALSSSIRSVLASVAVTHALISFAI
jgi:hypothetical protein